MTDEASPLDERAADRLLVEAIHVQRVRSVAADILSHAPSEANAAARARASAAIDACAAISGRMRDLRERMVAALRAAAIAAESILGPEDDEALQFDMTRIRVGPDDLATAIAVAQEQGFRPAVVLDAGRLKILARTATALQLVRFDGASARLELRFADQPRTWLPAMLHPRMRDLAAVDLPRPLSAFYWLVRPVRLVRERLTGRASTGAEGVLLGTPESLVTPLLRAMALSPADHFVDLGCGDGRVLSGALAFGCRVRGYECDAQLAQAARRRCAQAPDSTERVEILTEMFEGADLSDATAFFLFLPPHATAELIPLMQQRASRAIRILAHEQMRLPQTVPPPDESWPVFAPDAMTVAHLWHMPPPDR